MKPTLCEVIAVVISVTVIVQSAPAEKKEVRLVKQLNMRYPNGNYKYSFSLNDGTRAGQEGTLIEVNNTKVYRVTGYYEYKDSSDTLQLVIYQADEDGYNLRTPPIPRPTPTSAYISGRGIATMLGG